MRKVRIGATVRGAFDIALDLRVVAGCAGVWSILLLVAMLVDWAFHSRMRGIGELGTTAVTMLAFAGMAVNVHRRVLLGESPSLLRIGRSEMTYVGRTLVMGIFVAVMILVLVLLYFLGSYLLGLGLPGRILIGILCACVALVLLTELIGCVLVLPAAAVSEAGFRWSDAWKAAERNKLAILSVWVICGLPLALPSVALIAIEPRLAAWPGGSFAAEVARWIMTVAQSILTAAWISLVFSGLVDGNPDFAVTSTDGGGDA
jgi:hypothetical protein